MKKFLTRLGIYYALLCFLLFNIVKVSPDQHHVAYFGFWIITLPALISFGKYQKFRPFFDMSYRIQSAGNLLEMKKIEGKFKKLQGEIFDLFYTLLGAGMVIAFGFTAHASFWLCLLLLAIVMVFGIISSATYNIGYEVGTLFIERDEIEPLLSDKLESMQALGFNLFKGEKKNFLGKRKYITRKFLLRDGTCEVRDYEDLKLLHSKIYVEKILSDFEKFKKNKIEQKKRKKKKKEILAV